MGAANPAQARAAGLRSVYALSTLEPDTTRSIAAAGPLLERLAATIATEHLVPTETP